MAVYRIVASCYDNLDLDNNFKFFLLASLDDDKKIVPGQWFGYFDNEGYKYPFIMDINGGIFYDPESDLEVTNIINKHILSGEIFSFNINTDDECTYKITSVFELP
ncbi:hypothetical protein AB4458_23970 [Vibrio sp. 10N.261.45.F1]|jgi:hypothetical protein|uniref:hypothetical protein n=1 Tax=unclassified Vibrio TaxID=2614977 RepID=UPI00354FCAEE